MKRLLLITASIALLLLSWAALVDITTGTEPATFWNGCSYR